MTEVEAGAVQQRLYWLLGGHDDLLWRVQWDLKSVY